MLGNVPDGGGWRYVGRAKGGHNRAATTGKPRNRHYNPLTGTAFVHTSIDDHSPVAHAEIHVDETAAPTAGLLIDREPGRTVLYRLAEDFPKPLRAHCLRQLIDLTHHATGHDEAPPHRPTRRGSGAADEDHGVGDEAREQAVGDEVGTLGAGRDPKHLDHHVDDGGLNGSTNRLGHDSG